MLIFKGYNAVVEVLKGDAFYVLVSLHRYMKSKLLVRYYLYSFITLNIFKVGETI